MTRHALLSILLILSISVTASEQPRPDTLDQTALGVEWGPEPGELADSASPRLDSSIKGRAYAIAGGLSGNYGASSVLLPVTYGVGGATENRPELVERVSTGPVSVNNIRYSKASPLRVVVDLEGRPRFTRGEVENPPRVFIDIDDARIGAALQSRTFPVESGLLKSVRIGQYDPDTVRVVFDLTRLSDVSTFTLEQPDRLVVQVLEDRNGPRIGESFPIVPTTPDATSVASPAEPGGSGTHSLVRSLGLKVGRVVIDPGHGGRDTGTIGPSGLTEKELVLSIAKRLKEQIEDRLGAEVILTRRDDSFVGLETRTARANESGADLFLSIHANSSHAQSIRGFETYFLSLTASSEALALAARENAAAQASVSELQHLVHQIVLRDKVDESKEFATHIGQALASQRQLGRDRGVKQAPFVVLIGAEMPAALVEISFMSNPEDEQLLRGDTRRQEISEALFDGIRSYAETLSGFRTAQVRD